MSLLTAMTGKERTKCNAKGIFTITQMSYGYRPRGASEPGLLPRVPPNPPNVPSLSLETTTNSGPLALKKNQIHVVGARALKFESVPVFLDVEGMPDRDFYYLIGLRFECGGEQVERSFWADGLDGERAIWENCLETLKAIGTETPIT